MSASASDYSTTGTAGSSGGGLVITPAGSAESSSRHSSEDSASVRALLQRSPLQEALLQRFRANKEAFILGGSRSGSGGGSYAGSSPGGSSRRLPAAAAAVAAASSRLSAPVPALLADENVPSVPIIFVDLPASGDDNAAAAARARVSPAGSSAPSSAGSGRRSPPLPTSMVPSIERAAGRLPSLLAQQAQHLPPHEGEPSVPIIFMSSLPGTPATSQELIQLGSDGSGDDERGALRVEIQQAAGAAFHQQW